MPYSKKLIFSVIALIYGGPTLFVWVKIVGAFHFLDHIDTGDLSILKLAITIIMVLLPWLIFFNLTFTRVSILIVLKFKIMSEEELSNIVSLETTEMDLLQRICERKKQDKT